jgi:hypothetical protein
LFLMADSTRAAWALGARRIRFCATERAPETLSLARRFQATTLSILNSYMRRLS